MRERPHWRWAAGLRSNSIRAQAAQPRRPPLGAGTHTYGINHEPVKILRIIARLNVGGPARHVSLLNAGLQERGHDTLLAFGSLDVGEASLESAAVERGIPVVRIAGLGRRVDAAGDLRALVTLTRLMFREQPDVIHTHTAKAGTLGRIAALLYNATRRRARQALVLHTFHGHVFEGYFSDRISRLVRATERALARIADLIITISPRQREDIVTRFRIAAADRTVVVPLGLDLDPLFGVARELDGLRRTIGAEAGDLLVGYAGRLVPVKDLATLVRSFARAVSSVPELRLVLAGGGPERASLEVLAADLGVAERVHFLGWVDDLARFFGGVDLFALTSLNEGTPVAAIEAMAAGRPVVATAVGGVPDVVEHGSTGLLTPAGDVEAFASALVRLAEDQALREAMGTAGRARARERYSHHRLVSDIETLYEREVSRKRGDAR